MIVDSILPVFAVLALGSVLKRLRFTDDRFLRMSDRLIYFIFFPILLFWKIGSPSSTDTIDWTLIGAVLCAIACVYVLSLLFIRLGGTSRFEAGSFVQGCIRFSTYIGLAVIVTSLGEEGIRSFGLVIGFAIPFINILSVVTLVWYSRQEFEPGAKVRLVVREMFTNPLIIACFMGILYSRLNVPFPIALDITFKLVSAVTIPLALLSIGGSLSFSKLKGNLKLAGIAALMKLLVLPLVGYFILGIFGVSGMDFKVAMIYFALPTSPAIYILSSQLDSDLDLASATIVFSTLMSIASLSVVMALNQ
jgi:malonate transporter and related proteins